MLDFIALAQQCAPQVAPETMGRLVRVESGFNPFAIGVVNGRLERQPRNLADAVATARQLEKNGWNFSVGAAQINISNLKKFNVAYEQAFDVCKSLSLGSGILKECYERAKLTRKDDQEALAASFSCYYSGNFKTGFKPDFKGQPSYVQKVLAANGAVELGTAIPVISSAKKETANAKGMVVPAPANAAARTSAPAADASASVPADVMKALETGPVKKKRGGIPAELNGFAKDRASSALDGFGNDSGEPQEDDE